MLRSDKRAHHDILQLFEAAKSEPPGFLRVSAPMVRYSKCEFRKLLRMNGVQLAFTPMIIADSFNNSQKARDNEFTTTYDDQPLIAQFAASNAEDFATAAQLIYPYVDGVDLNCGCPQTWAITKNYGCGLLRHVEQIRDIVQTTRRRLPQDFSISVKFRLIGSKKTNTCIQETVELARQLEHCGVTFLTLHGRHVWEGAADAVNISALSAVKQSIQVPLIANGNVRSWQDAYNLYEETHADGIMAARGLLTKPTLFNAACADQKTTGLPCVQQWINIAAQAGDNIQFQCFHHHLTFMWNSNLNRLARVEFNTLTNKAQILEFFERRYDIRPTDTAQQNPFTYTKCTYVQKNEMYISKTDKEEEINSWHGKTQGKYFKEFTETSKSEENDFGLEDSFFLNELHNI